MASREDEVGDMMSALSGSGINAPKDITSVPSPITLPDAKRVSDFISNPTGATALTNITPNAQTIAKYVNNPPLAIPAGGALITAPRKSNDTRVRIKAPLGLEKQIYGDNVPSNILSVLYKSDGLLFPFTPSIQINQDVDYRTTDLVHANGDIFSYARTPSVSISISGKFAIQNQAEGKYALAVLHFLRVASKMYFGDADEKAGKAGLPPPVLNLSGYGQYMFNSVKVILKSHSYSLEDNVDYISVQTNTELTRLPALFTVSLTLGVIQTPSAMRKEFSLDTFRTGQLMRNTKGWI